MRKSYLFAFIDDMTRLVPHAGVLPQRGINSFIDAFIKAPLEEGLPRKLYVDNGPAFSTQILRHANASLGIALSTRGPTSRGTGEDREVLPDGEDAASVHGTGRAHP
jgi:hypothetical protein